MRYSDIELDMQWTSEPSALSLIKYIPIRGQRSAPTSRFMLDFKQNEFLALRKARNLALQALREYEEDLAEFRYGYLVTIPSHAAGGTNKPCEYLCAELAKAFPRRLVHIRQALRRVVEVQKSATSAPGERPEYSDHVRSIRYDGPQRLRPGVGIILVDDILTRGETFRACRDILKKATGCTDVPGLFVARTTHV